MEDLLTMEHPFEIYAIIKGGQLTSFAYALERRNLEGIRPYRTIYALSVDDLALHCKFFIMQASQMKGVDKLGMDNLINNNLTDIQICPNEEMTTESIQQRFEWSYVDYFHVFEHLLKPLNNL